jgi:hypothetical protein
VQHQLQLRIATLLLALIIIVPSAKAGLVSNNITYTANNTFIAPTGCYWIYAEVTGGGGHGGNRITNGGGGGGGGGAFSTKNFSVVPGQSVDIRVGAGDTATNAPATVTYGQDTWVNSTATVLAKGGSSVLNNTATGAWGGNASQGVGTVTKDGGDGGLGNTTQGGGGGGAGGNAAHGNNGTGRFGGNVVQINGGGGGLGPIVQAVGAAGNASGGGGAGSLRTSVTTRIGGSGAAGIIRLIYINDTGELKDWNRSNAAPKAGYENLTSTGAAQKWDSTNEFFYIDGGTAPCFNIPTSDRTNMWFPNTPNMTMSAWVKNNGSNSNTPVITNLRFNFGSSLGQLLQIDNAGMLKMWMGATTVTSNTAQTVNNSWTHLAAVYNNTAVRYFRNGINTDNQSFAAKNGSSSASFIGCEAGGTNTWNGSLKNIIVVNRSLSYDEVYGLYLNRSDVGCDQMIQMYPFSANAQYCGHRNAVSFGGGP